MGQKLSQNHLLKPLEKPATVGMAPQIAIIETPTNTQAKARVYIIRLVACSRYFVIQRRLKPATTL